MKKKIIKWSGYIKPSNMPSVVHKRKGKILVGIEITKKPKFTAFGTGNN